MTNLGLIKLNLIVENQVPLNIEYQGQEIEGGLRLDLRVQSSVIVEIKAVESLLPIHQAQLLTYLKLSQLSLGYLINFNVPLLKNGIKRMVLNPTKTAVTAVSLR